MRFNIILKLAYKFALHILKADQSGSLDDFGAVIYGEIVTIGDRGAVDRLSLLTRGETWPLLHQFSRDIAVFMLISHPLKVIRPSLKPLCRYDVVLLSNHEVADVHINKSTWYSLKRNVLFVDE